MKINKIKIKKSKLDLNFKLYLFLKELNGANKLTENELSQFLQTYFSNNKLSLKKIKDIFLNHLENLSDKKKEKIGTLLYQINDEVDFKIFIFSLKLIQIKKVLLEEAKLSEISEMLNLSEINQLSLEYDTLSKSKPYYTRVNGALLSLLFFYKLEERDAGFISESTEQYINSLFDEYEYLKNKGLEANQMFMLMFSESIDQSIISEAGSSYEDRIYNILIGLGIPSENIKKIHDSNDSSMEYDFFFTLKNRTYGIGAKRTLRERYKQFIKTNFSTKIDVTIEITLGLDLSEEKAKSIVKQGVCLFVADEIYESKKYLQDMKGVYSAKELNLKTLYSL